MILNRYKGYMDSGGLAFAVWGQGGGQSCKYGCRVLTYHHFHVTDPRRL